MKFYITLTILVLSIVLSLNIRIKLNNNEKSLIVDNSKKHKDFEQYFWVQKIAPTKDPYNFLVRTQRFNKQKLIKVNEEFITLSSKSKDQQSN